MAQNYYKFIENWDGEEQNFIGFFGLRDFYSFIKYVCQKISEGISVEVEIQKIVSESIQINFDGQLNSLEAFYKISGINRDKKFYMNPLDLIEKNL